jgi:hypothetical protein
VRVLEGANLCELVAHFIEATPRGSSHFFNCGLGDVERRAALDMMPLRENGGHCNRAPLWKAKARLRQRGTKRALQPAGSTE